MFKKTAATMLHVIYNKFILTKILHSLPRATELK